MFLLQSTLPSFGKGKWVVNKMADAGVFSGSRDAAVIDAILKEMGIEEYEPGVINQMLEFSNSKWSVLISTKLVVNLSGLDLGLLLVFCLS